MTTNETCTHDWVREIQSVSAAQDIELIAGSTDMEYGSTEMFYESCDVEGYECRHCLAALVPTATGWQPAPTNPPLQAGQQIRITVRVLSADNEETDTLADARDFLLEEIRYQLGEKHYRESEWAINTEVFS